MEISELLLPAIVIQILQSIKELACHTFDNKKMYPKTSTGNIRLIAASNSSVAQTRQYMWMPVVSVTFPWGSESGQTWPPYLTPPPLTLPQGWSESTHTRVYGPAPPKSTLHTQQSTSSVFGLFLTLIRAPLPNRIWRTFGTLSYKNIYLSFCFGDLLSFLFCLR